MNSTTIADRLTELHHGMAGQMPEGALSAFSAEQVGLDAAGLPADVAAPGVAMPDARLLDVNGASTTLALALNRRAAVVVLYRGAWCPYCNIALNAYQHDLVPQLAERGVPLVAISPQKPDGSLSTQEKNALSFTVLSDRGNQVAKALGVLTAPTDDARGAQRALGIDVADFNADGTDSLPMPTVVVADADRIIRWIDVHPNYATRTEVSDILNALDDLN
jgi:peroxiredoxin